jgi:ankyrin repeat protein
LLIDHDADIQTRNKLQRNALFESIKVSDTDGADLLLFNGIDGSAYDLKANTVLHEAARIGAYEHTVLFIDQGLDPNHFNVEGFTSLHLAIQNGHVEISLALLKKGADTKAHDRKAGSARTPLTYAASAGLMYLCENLLCHKVDVDAVSSDGKTALMLAAAASNVEVMQLLCLWRPSANLKMLDNEGHSPLKFAADAGHVSIVQLLLDKGADVRGLKYEPGIPEDTAAEITQRRIRYLLGKHGAIVAGKILNSVIGEEPA